VNNTSDVEVYPNYEITGPVENLVISLGSLSFGFGDPLSEGEVISVNTEEGTVKDSAGGNRYDLLAASPKLFPFQPGISVVLVSGTDANATTSIVCNYNLRYEVVHNAD